MMRRTVVCLALTAAAVVALARFQTHAPRTVNPNSALRPPPRLPAKPRPGVRVGTSPALTTPFSVIQVRATVTRGRLTAVQTVALTGDGPHTQALNARAEPILRSEALRAGSARVHTVSGATYTSRAWRDSLREAIARAGGVTG